MPPRSPPADFRRELRHCYGIHARENSERISPGTGRRASAGQGGKAREAQKTREENYQKFNCTEATKGAAFESWTIFWTEMEESEKLEKEAESDNNLIRNEI